MKLRASLCASQLVGIGIMRYAVRTEPLHSMGVDELVDAVAPTIQRYLTGTLSSRSAHSPDNWNSTIAAAVSTASLNAAVRAATVGAASTAYRSA